MRFSLSGRQAAMFCSVMILASKLLILPSLLFAANNTSAIFSVILIFLLEFGFLYFLIKLKQKNKNLSFFNIFKNKIGIFLTKIILFLLFLFFLLKTIYILQESFSFLKRTLYIDAPISLFLICVLPVATTFAYKGLKPFGRTLEIFYWFIIGLIVACTLVWTVSIANLNFSLVGNNGINGFLEATFNYTFWFGDFIFFMFILDKVQFEENTQKQILLFSGLTMLFAVFFMIAYFITFQTTAFTHSFALLNIVQFVSDFGTVGKLDIFPITAIMLIIFFQLGMLISCATECFEKIIPFGHKAQSLIAINALLILTSYIIFNNANSLVIFYSDFLFCFCIVLCFLVPILYLTFAHTHKAGDP